MAEGIKNIGHASHGQHIDVVDYLSCRCDFSDAKSAKNSEGFALWSYLIDEYNSIHKAPIDRELT